jgi:hypothetical protein
VGEERNKLPGNFALLLNGFQKNSRWIHEMKKNHLIDDQIASESIPVGFLSESLLGFMTHFHPFPDDSFARSVTSEMYQ